MGNRRHHKKLRVEVRARMARTGETYQQALTRIQASRSRPAAPHVDLIAVRYFGVPTTLATYELAERLACIVVSSELHHGPFPPPLVALAARGPHVVH